MRTETSAEYSADENRLKNQWPLDARSTRLFPSCSSSRADRMRPSFNLSVRRLESRLASRRRAEQGKSTGKMWMRMTGEFLLSFPAWSTLWIRSIPIRYRSEEHTSELQSRGHLVC